MLDKVAKYYYTIKDLKWIQIFYQLKYKIYRSKFTRISYTGDVSHILKSAIVVPTERYHQNHSFTFLNVHHTFTKHVEWGFISHGLLWNYNLNYFDFLQQDRLSVSDGTSLIMSFINSHDGNYDPYPTSLRIINWIDFISKHKIESEVILNALFSQAKHLYNNLEYHLLGNHLLENGFALFHAAYFFNNGQFYSKSIDILRAEMNEQVLDDGGHFELSPMYHLIILNRVLEVVDIAVLNVLPQQSLQLIKMLESKASMMLGWIENMTYRNGKYPHFNDSVDGIAPNVMQIKSLAKKLGLTSSGLTLGVSGYRGIEVGDLEAFIDVGSIGPSYIPGHGHSDIGNFEINIENRPYVVDTAISTYEKNQIRQRERSTESHNTVEAAGYEQSDVWGGFRVGRKAEVLGVKASDISMEVSYKGFGKLQTIHKRKFHWTEKSIDIKDTVDNSKACKAFIHFHSDIKIERKDTIFRTNYGSIEFENMLHVEIDEYELAIGFNKRIKSKRLTITFKEWLSTKFQFE